MKTGEKELAELTKLKKIAEDLDAQERAAREEVTRAAEKYRAAIAEHVHELLRGLVWKKSFGHGSKGKLVADLPKGHELTKIDSDLCGCGYAHYLIFGPVSFHIYSRGWGSQDRYVQASKECLEKIGIKMKRSVNKDRQKMSRLLAKHDVTPEELEELLKKAKK